MKIKYKQDYLSIEKFNDIEFADFTVLTGVNGSGKSHLLEAIKKKKVSIKGYENSNIVLFERSTFQLDDERLINSQSLYREKEEVWDFFKNSGVIMNTIKKQREDLGVNYKTIVALCEEKNKNLFSLTSEDISNDVIFNQLKSYKQNIENHFRSNQMLKNNKKVYAILMLIKKLPYSIDEIEPKVFSELYKPYDFKKDFLPLQLGKIIWDYYVRYDDNKYRRFKNDDDGGCRPVLSEEEFISKYGEKPWEVINNILSKFGTLKYKIDSPEELELDRNVDFQLKPVNKEGGEGPSNFSELSSGEKILMALVASIYKSSSDNHFPDILLLDEIDASLHPSMIENLLNVIKDIFLKKGIKVILVTHSPTTIALAPKESIFVMNERGENRIEKSSNKSALKILTEGFATLEEGLKFFDEVAKNKLTIITEGKNTKYIKKYVELKKIKDVDILTGVEGKSGETQLKTLYDFFIKIPHDNEVLFVWDCDVNKYRELEEKNKTSIFVFEQNTENNIAKKGIENLFSVELFEGFYTEIKKADGIINKSFEENRKNEFLQDILKRNNIDDFEKFKPLLNKIESLLNVEN